MFYKLIATKQAQDRFQSYTALARIIYIYFQALGLCWTTDKLQDSKSYTWVNALHTRRYFKLAPRWKNLLYRTNWLKEIDQAEQWWRTLNSSTKTDQTEQCWRTLNFSTKTDQAEQWWRTLNSSTNGKLHKAGVPPEAGWIIYRCRCISPTSPGQCGAQLTVRTTQAGTQLTSTTIHTPLTGDKPRLVLNI